MTPNWTEKPLGEIMTLQRGFDLPKEQRREGQVPIISSSGVDDFHAVAAKQGPGVVTGRYGTIGKVYYSEEPYWPLNTTLFVSNFHGNSQKYCYYLLSRLDFHEYSGKTGVPGVNRNDLHTIRVQATIVPKEQQAIAEALSDADALIEGLERLIAKKRLIKQGAMQDLLTARRRLPGFSGEWVKTPLGDIGAFVGGGTPSMARDDFWKDGTVPWVSSSDVRIGELHSAERLITVTAIKGSSTRVVEPGSILFVTRSGILRRFQPVMINTVPVAINQDIKALLPRSSAYSPAYVFHAAVAAGDRILRDCMKTGTTVESIDLNALRRFEIDCPSDQNEQDATASVLTDMDAEIQALETRLEKTRQIKEGMMQNLLTGRIRLV